MSENPSKTSVPELENRIPLGEGAERGHVEMAKTTGDIITEALEEMANEEAFVIDEINRIKGLKELAPVTVEYLTNLQKQIKQIRAEHQEELERLVKEEAELKEPIEDNGEVVLDVDKDNVEAYTIHSESVKQPPKLPNEYYSDRDDLQVQPDKRAMKAVFQHFFDEEARDGKLLNNKIIEEATARRDRRQTLKERASDKIKLSEELPFSKEVDSFKDYKQPLAKETSRIFHELGEAEEVEEDQIVKEMPDDEKSEAKIATFRQARATERAVEERPKSVAKSYDSLIKEGRKNANKRHNEAMKEFDAIEEKAGDDYLKRSETIPYLIKTVENFKDYSNPLTKETLQILRQLESATGNKVNFLVKSIPLSDVREQAKRIFALDLREEADSLKNRKKEIINNLKSKNFSKNVISMVGSLIDDIGQREYGDKIEKEKIATQIALLSVEDKLLQSELINLANIFSEFAPNLTPSRELINQKIAEQKKYIAKSAKALEEDFFSTDKQKPSEGEVEAKITQFLNNIGKDKRFRKAYVPMSTQLRGFFDSVRQGEMDTPMLLGQLKLFVKEGLDHQQIGGINDILKDLKSESAVEEKDIEEMFSSDVSMEQEDTDDNALEESDENAPELAQTKNKSFLWKGFTGLFRRKPKDDIKKAA